VPSTDEMAGGDDDSPDADDNSMADKDDDSMGGEDQNTREYLAPADQFGKGKRMRLRNQPRRNYDVFNLNGEMEVEEILLLQFNHDNDCKLDERALDRLETEWLFLTEKLEWKEGMSGISGSNNARCSEGVTLLAECLFVSKQMGWKKGLKKFQEQGEIAIEKERKQIHDMEGFQPRHWFELTEKNEYQH